MLFRIQPSSPVGSRVSSGVRGKEGEQKKGGGRDTQEERKRRRATRVRDGSREEKE